MNQVTSVSDGSVCARLEHELKFLFDRINYERQSGFGYPKHFKLDSMRRLLNELHNPQDRYRIIHVAGTKGKGSVARMIGSALHASGIRCGIYSSPHLESIRERIVVDNQLITPGQLADLLGQVRQAVTKLDGLADRRNGRKPSFFEMITAAAMKHFSDQNVERVVLEVGLGGRLDSTNVCNPELCVITNISLDHTRQLGSTLDRIAREKAGIIKSMVPVISGATHPLAASEILETCSVNNSALFELESDFGFDIQSTNSVDFSQIVDFWFKIDSIDCNMSNVRISTVGRHQAENAAVALAALKLVSQNDQQITETAMRRSMGEFSMTGRFDVLAKSPLIIVDMAHNTVSVEALVNTIQTLKSDPTSNQGKTTLIFGSSSDKQVDRMLEAVVPAFERVILTSFVDNPRAMPVSELARLAAAASFQAETSYNPSEAWRLAQQNLGNDDLICVTGSAFLIAEIRPIIKRWLAARD